MQAPVAWCAACSEVSDCLTSSTTLVPPDCSSWRLSHQSTHSPRSFGTGRVVSRELVPASWDGGRVPCRKATAKVSGPSVGDSPGARRPRCSCQRARCEAWAACWASSSAIPNQTWALPCASARQRSASPVAVTGVSDGLSCGVFIAFPFKTCAPALGGSRGIGLILLQGDVAFADHIAPFLEFGRNECRRVFAGAGHGLRTARRQELLHGRLDQDFVERRIEGICDVGGQVGRASQEEPGRYVKAFQAI